MLNKNNINLSIILMNLFLIILIKISYLKIIEFIIRF